jgi:hypothetical protein
MNVAIIDKMSDLLKLTLEETRETLKDKWQGHKLTYFSMVEILKRIEKGEKGLHDPDNSGDQLALALAKMHIID